MHTPKSASRGPLQTRSRTGAWLAFLVLLALAAGLGVRYGDSPPAGDEPGAPGSEAAVAEGPGVSPAGEGARREIPIEAVLVDRREPDGGREIRRTRIVRTTLKYPWVRVEETPEGTVEMVADHVIVRIREGKSEADLIAIAGPAGFSIRRRFESPRLFLVALPGPASDLRGAITFLATCSGVVEFAEPDVIARTAAVPDDPLFAQQWGLDNRARPLVDIGAPEAWDSTTGSRGVIVGILDSGMDLAHPDLAPNLWTNAGEVPDNGLDDDGNGRVDDVHGWDFLYETNRPQDEFGHGTQVAGIIGAAGNNGAGVSGVCWTVSLAPLRVVDMGFVVVSDAIAAIEYAIRERFDVLNMSWGGGGSEALRLAIAAAGESGILVVAGAGNDGTDNDARPFYPASYAEDNIIAVTATDSADARWGNFGLRSVDLGAPGVGVWTTNPAWSGTPWVAAGGTSYATPFVTGACALLKAANPTFSAAEIRSRILSQVEPVPSLAGRTTTGGRLDLFRAIAPADPALYAAGIAVDDSNAAGYGFGYYGGFYSSQYYGFGYGYGSSSPLPGQVDGFANPGEYVMLTITLLNMGRQPARNVWATLEFAEPQTRAWMISSWNWVDQVPARGSATVAFWMYVGPDAAVPARLPLCLTAGDDAGRTWTDDLSIRIGWSGRIAGTVTLDGAPLAGAAVSYEGLASGTVLTGADGAYEIRGEPGDYRLYASRSGFVPTDPVAVTAWDYGDTFANFTFTTASVSGRVISTSGSPVAGATVAWTGPGDLAGTATTAADGGWIVTRVFGRRAPLNLVARHPSWADSAPRLVTLPPSLSGVDFVLGPPRIQAVPASISISAQLGTTPTRTLSISNTGGGLLTFSVATARRVAGTAGTVLARLDLPESLGRLNGIAFDGRDVWTSTGTNAVLTRLDAVSGAPLGTLEIAADPPLLLGGLSWDGTRLWASDSYDPRLVSLDPATGASRILRIDGFRPAQIAAGGGAIFAQHGQNPSSVAKIDPATGVITRRLTLPAGVFGLAWLNGSLWTATHPTAGTLREIDPESGAVVRTIPGPQASFLRLASDAERALWTWDQDRRQLQIVDTGQTAPISVTPSSGSAAPGRPAELTLTVNTLATGSGVFSLPLRVRSNDPATPELVVPVTLWVWAPRSIRGTVTLDGAPLAAAVVSYSGPGARLYPRTVATAADGRFSIPVTAAPWSVFAGKADALPTLPRTVDTTLASAVADFALTTATVRGRVLSLGGAPIAGARVDASGPLSGSVLTAGDGSWSFARVYGRPAALTFRAQAAGYPASGPRTALVPPDAELTFTLGTPAVAVSPGSVYAESAPGAASTVRIAISNIGGSGLSFRSWSKVEPNGAPIGRELRRIAAPDNGFPLDVAFDGTALWISHGMWGSGLDRIDPATGAVLQHLALPSSVREVDGLAWDGSCLWGADSWSNLVFALDPATGRLVKSFALDFSPFAIEIAHGQLYVLEMDGGFRRLSPADGAVLETRSFPDSYASLAWCNGALWCGAQTPRIDRLSPLTGALQGSIPAPFMPVSGAAADAAGDLWIASYYDRSLVLLETGFTPWLSVSPASGVVDGLSSTEVDIRLDAAGLPLGTYSGEIHVATNDPGRPEVVVPVTLTVR